MSDRSLRLIVFDVDGTLIDSLALILAAMRHAFEATGRIAPSREAVRGIIGLSLPRALSILGPDPEPHAVEELVAQYRRAFDVMLRSDDGPGAAPLFPGARATLDRLVAQGPETLVGIATGKARPGLDSLLALHGLGSYFTTLQTADRHPSKPHPAMLEACLAETGVAADQAVMIGDTTFDIEMGRAAGLRTIGVTWGYHAPAHLQAAGADRVIDRFEALDAAVEALL